MYNSIIRPLAQARGVWPGLINLATCSNSYSKPPTPRIYQDIMHACTRAKYIQIHTYYTYRE